MSVWDVGDEPELFVSFQQVDETPMDPTEVVLEVMKPNGDIVTYRRTLDELTRDAEGEYSKLVLVDQAGLWRYRWTGTGAINAAQPGHFTVRQSVFE